MPLLRAASLILQKDPLLTSCPAYPRLPAGFACRSCQQTGCRKPGQETQVQLPLQSRLAHNQNLSSDTSNKFQIKRLMLVSMSRYPTGWWQPLNDHCDANEEKGHIKY